jgi:hypothetical protein
MSLHSERRTKISHIENSHGGAYRRMHGSDDWAVELLEKVANANHTFAQKATA